MPFSTAANAPAPSVGPSIRMGASMPASRSAMPSSISATARKLAPASSAAFAQGTAPWP